MKICIIGAGYVGLSASLCFASANNLIYCYDNNKEKIKKLKSVEMPFYEPKAEELLNKYKNNIIFLDKFNLIPEDIDIYFIAVGTPTLENNEVDTSSVDKIIENIINKIQKYTLIVNKSTVPIGYNKKIKESYKNKTTINFDIVSNPEFLRQGNAIDDFLNPQRVIIGTNSKKAQEILINLYSELNIDKNKIITMDENSAEIVKYSSNSFLALKISFINEIANLCEKAEADINSVILGISKDERIGNKFLNPGIGFGGSCFPKDTKAILNIAKKFNTELKTIESAISVNNSQIEIFIKKILECYNNEINRKTFAIWGLSFKPNTSDTREAPSIKIIEKLQNLGAKINVFDPKAKLEKLIQAKSKEDALKNADALIILTEWDEFKNPDFELIRKNLKDKIIFDGRNIYINKNLKKYGLQYHCVGKYE